ncbi:MAG: hypothetical protein ACXU60_05470 [Croceibacterium sp.]
MPSLAQIDLGFRTAYRVTFERILPAPGPLDATLPPVPIPTIVPVSSPFFEADIRVDMDATEAGNGFEMTVHGLGDDIYGLLVPQKTIVHIALGYDDTDVTEVMTGLLTEKSLKAGDQWYEATLKGVDFVFDRLQRPLKPIAENFRNATVGEIASAICRSAGVDTKIPDRGPTLETISFRDRTPLDALNELARIAGFSLRAKDGKLWMGTPDALGVTQTIRIDDGATSRPVATRGATAAASPLDGQDFDIAGLPALRPDDLVILGTKTLRIQSISHKFTREGGYTCCGRALSPDVSDDDAQKAGRPSAGLVARQLRQNLLQRDRIRPAVDIGDVRTYREGIHTATLDLGHDATPDMSSPSVQATLRDTPVALHDKPIASPFAFDKCGLVVPVYPKMRSLLAHGWNEPEDAVMAGFVWTAGMTLPKNQPGDWWLCLPTEIDGDGKPTGGGVDDLITQNGQRVIQVKGLKITIGSGLLNPVGARPTPGTDETLTIESDDNKTRMAIKAGEIEMTDGSVTLTIAGGKISIK